MTLDYRLDDYQALLQKTQPFCYFSTRTLQNISEALQLVKFQPGEVIQAEGELPYAVHSIVQGQVRIIDTQQTEHRTIAKLTVGETFGWEALLRGVSLGAVRAAGLETEVLTLALNADVFERIAKSEAFERRSESVQVLELYDLLVHFAAAVPTFIQRFRFCQNFGRNGSATSRIGANLESKSAAD